MKKWLNNDNPQAKALVEKIRKRAGNLYKTRQFLCTEAVLVTLNKAFKGGLTDAQAIAVSAPFGIAMGNSGCICGALSGAVLACGLLIGADQPYRNRQRVRRYARQLHDEFKTAYGSTCCRVLSRSVRHDQEVHFEHCARLTEGAAEMAASLILYLRPELTGCTEDKFINKTDSRIGTMMKSLIRIVCLKKM